MSDPELEKFKRDIDLRPYAAAQGYVLDRKDSWRGSAVMRQACGDKVSITRDIDGHYVYYSFRDDRDHGTIIDFAMRRLGLSLGKVREELRSFNGRPSSGVPPYPALPKVAKDRHRVEREYARMQDAPRHPYIENLRGIPAGVLQFARFAGRIKIDARGNAVFPHFDADGLSGYELKNSAFTGFASGGVKSLWISNAESGDARMVFCESAIDALSYAVLFPDDRTRYASIGGKPSPAQTELIRTAVARMPVAPKSSLRWIPIRLAANWLRSLIGLWNCRAVRIFVFARMNRWASRTGTISCGRGRKPPFPRSGRRLAPLKGRLCSADAARRLTEKAD